MKPLACVWIGLLAVVLAGCNSLQDPTVRVSSVSVQEVTPEGVRALVELELSNPNDTPVPLTESTYNVTLNGLGTKSYNQRLARTIPASGRQTVLLPAAWAYEGATTPGGPQSISVEGSVTYEPPGEVREVLTESNVPLPSVAFSQQGVIELSQGAAWRAATPAPAKQAEATGASEDSSEGS